MNARAVLDALSKALVTVAVMLSILLIAKGPALGSRPVRSPRCCSRSARSVSSR